MKKINEDIKNNTYKTVYLLYGEEEYLKRQYKNKFIDAICVGDTMNYSYYEGKGIDIKELMREKSKEIFKRELKYRECILGPHRDDIEFKINGSDLKLFGSQGQQKTAILVQKIAEVELFREEIGEYPILLLDDIMSELDNSRQDYVLNKLEEMQIFITCTDSERFKTLEKGKFIKIDKGCVTECTSI